MNKMNSFGLNVSAIKQNNRSLILKLLRDKGPLSRKDMAVYSGLTPAAVTNIVNEMINQKLLKETGHVSGNGKPGRRRILVDIDKSQKFIIGINIGTKKIALGVSDMDMNLLDYEEIEISDREHPEKLLMSLGNRVLRMLWELNIVKENVIGAGVGIVGSVDPESGKSNFSYGIWNESVNIREILQKQLGVRVVVENNVRALAISEFNLRRYSNVNNLIFVKHGPGLGSAVIVNRHLFYGSTNNAGEIGHMVIEKDGPVCRCGQKGCLEALISTDKIISEVSKKFGKDETPWLFSNRTLDDLKFEDIIQAYEKSDMGVQAVVEKVLDYLVLGITNVMKIFDPEKVILYGIMFKSDKVMKSLLKKIEELTSNTKASSKVEISNLDSKNKVIGGLSLVLERLFYEREAIFNKNNI